MTQIEGLTILLSRIIDQIYCNESSRIICIIVSGSLKKKKKSFYFPGTKTNSLISGGKCLRLYCALH